MGRAFGEALTELRAAINNQAAELATMRLLLAAALRQLPDQQKLLDDFSAMSEDSTVLAMNSMLSESYFQSFQKCCSTWESLLDRAIAQTKPPPP